MWHLITRNNLQFVPVTWHWISLQSRSYDCPGCFPYWNFTAFEFNLNDNFEICKPLYTSLHSTLNKRCDFALKSIFIMTSNPRTWITSTYGLVNTLVDTGCIVKIFQSTNINILYLLFDKAESTVFNDLNYVKCQKWKITKF